MIKRRYFKLCVRAISGQISPKEKVALDGWLERSSENREYYDQLAKAWSEQAFPPLPLDPDVDKAWSGIEKSLQEIPTNKRTSFILANTTEILKDFLGSAYRPVLITGATILVFAVVFLVWRMEFFRSPYTTEVTRNKQILEFTLSDSTHVRLNSGSSIKFPALFSESSREVVLSGEAFFRVSRDVRSFTVVTKQARTTVLGTEFNVWTRGNETRVIVKEGRVRFHSLNPDGHYVDLFKDQRSQIVGRLPPEPPGSVDADYLLGWLKGQLVFRKTPLSEIVAELERTYDVPILLANSHLGDLTMTAEFADASIDEILSSICLTLNIGYTVESDEYILNSK